MAPLAPPGYAFVLELRQITYMGLWRKPNQDMESMNLEQVFIRKFHNSWTLETNYPILAYVETLADYNALWFQ